MGSISPWHLLLVAIVVIVVFGSKRLPDTARSLGKSMRILKSETQAMRNENNPPAPDPGTANSTEQQAPRTIQAAPGDVSTARPVQEPKGTTQS